MWYCVIQDLVLYLHKDEQCAKKGLPPQVGQNAVRLHHAVAQRAVDYSKKEHVFRLHTSDQAEYLLQTRLVYFFIKIMLNNGSFSVITKNYKRGLMQSTLWLPAFLRLLWLGLLDLSLSSRDLFYLAA